MVVERMYSSKNRFYISICTEKYLKSPLYMYMYVHIQGVYIYVYYRDEMKDCIFI